jgi:hypothetical protein
MAIKLYSTDPKYQEAFTNSKQTHEFLMLMDQAFDVMNRRTTASAIKRENWNTQKAVM